jgi:serine O-acetyltransferase
MSARDDRCIAAGHHHLRGVWANLYEDISRFLNKSPENQAVGDTLRSRTGALLTPQLMCLVVYRLSHYANCRGWARLGAMLSGVNLLAHKVSISPESCIGPGCLLPHPAGVSFCGRAGSGLTLYSLAVCGPFETSLGGPLDAAPVLGDRVTVGGRAVVLGPVRLGNDVRMLAVRVADDVPDGCLVMCRVVRTVRTAREDLVHAEAS